MTHGEREDSEQGPAPAAVPARVVVVAADAERLGMYAVSMRMAQVQTLLTLDPDEAVAALEEHAPEALILDRGLPRMVLLRLYGTVRGNADKPAVKVVFVGQDGDDGPDDRYLPGEPSPLTVAARVSDMIADGSEGSPWSAGSVTLATLAPSIDSEPPIGEAPVAPEPSDPIRRHDPQPGSGPVTHQDWGRVADVAPTATSPESLLSRNQVGPGHDGSLGSGDGAALRAEGDAVETVAVGAVRETAPERRLGMRLDLLLFRLGLVLLIIGGVLYFFPRPENSVPALTPPPLAPATPTRAPSASPSPGARFDETETRFVADVVAASARI